MSKKPSVILVVDDAPENIDVLSGILSPEYTVKAAINGARALKIALSEQQPDLILLDIMMPDIDGYEVCTQLKKDPRTRAIPVIFVTAMSEIDNEKRGFSLGAVDYITKPVSPSIVRARVKTQLALYHQNRELEETVLERTKEVRDTQLKLIQCLGKAAEYRDNETGAHVIRVGRSSQLLALAAGFSDEEAEKLLFAAPMHDVGKIGIRDEILLKPGKLTSVEFDIIKTHTTIGAEIIGNDESEVLQLAKVVAIAHHEKWDGSGYPFGLQGEDIPIVGRIVAIVDVFDALTSSRPYKDPWPLEQVVDFFKEQTGKHFDPSLCSKFLELIPQVVALRDEFPDEEA